jgi:putative endonuclease
MTFFLITFEIKHLDMARHNDTGKAGEEEAGIFLERHGYAIEQRNWRCGRAEIDLIARKGDQLVFVEVKTRSNLSYGRPELFVDSRKAARIAAAAGAYMQQVAYEWIFRFDVIAVIYRGRGMFSIRHFEDAFFPTRV